MSHLVLLQHAKNAINTSCIQLQYKDDEMVPLTTVALFWNMIGGYIALALAGSTSIPQHETTLVEYRPRLQKPEWGILCKGVLYYY